MVFYAAHSPGLNIGGDPAIGARSAAQSTNKGVVEAAAPGTGCTANVPGLGIDSPGRRRGAVAKHTPPEIGHDAGVEQEDTIRINRSRMMSQVQCVKRPL